MSTRFTTKAFAVPMTRRSSTARLARIVPWSPLDLDFSNPLRFPPAETAGIAVLRVSDRPGRDEIDAVVERLTEALASTELAGHLWVIDASRVRQYQPPDS